MADQRPARVYLGKITYDIAPVFSTRKYVCKVILDFTINGRVELYLSLIATHQHVNWGDKISIENFVR